MATIEFNATYMTVRSLVWTSFAVAYFGWLVSRASVASSKPRALPYMIATSVALFAVRDIWILIAITSLKLFAFYIRDMANSVAWGAMLGVLLVVASGYSITTTSLSEISKFVFALPIIFATSGTITGWLALILRGQGVYDEESERQQEEIYVYLVAGLIQTAILVVSWVHISDSSEAVAKRLDAQAPGAAARRTAAASNPDDPERAAAFAAAVEATVTTIGEEAERVTAARLMRRFKLATTAFCLGFALVLFLPAFTSASGSTATDIALFCWNGLLLALCLALAWTFRISEEKNVYLQLGADGEDAGGLETHIEMSGMAGAGVRADEPVHVDAAAPDPDDNFTID